MMSNLGIRMQVTCNTATVLKALRANRENHARLVDEARAGFIEKARVALEKKLGQLREGKVTSLAVGLSVPLNYTEVYDTAIHMLEHHTAETVALSADEYRHLMDDIWDWSSQWITNNLNYSPSTRAYGASKGIDTDD